MKNQFEAVVFAGGGCRSVWQVGFWDVLSKNVSEPPKYVAAVSAGAAMAAIILAEKIKDGLSLFKKKAAANPKNMYWENLWSNRPVFPQYSLYREIMLQILDDSALQKIKQKYEFNILLARPPKIIPPLLDTILGMILYNLEKKFVQPIHPIWAQKFRYTPEVVSVNQLLRPVELVDTILQSSCTPPFTPFMKREGQTVLDGGIIDNVPLMALNKPYRSVLILLTRQYQNLNPRPRPGICYVAPSSPVPIDRWDYTNPEGVDAAYELGKSDATRFVRAV